MFSRRPGFRFSRRITAGPVTAGGGGGGDTDPPGIAVGGIVINADGVSGRITFDEDMSTGATPTVGSITLNNTLATISGFSWASATELDFTIASYTVIGSAFATVTMSYTAGVAPLKDVANNNLADFSGASLTNNSIHAPMVHIETLLSGTSWTSPADLFGTSLFVEGWAAGEGGQTATKAGDSGGYCNKTDTIAANTAYSYSIGAAGTTGGGNGGDIAWRTNVMVVPGGASATSAVGDVTRAGQTGTSGAGSTTGGGSPGTTGGASGATPGEPNGAPGMAGNVVARLPGAGGGSTGSAQRAGAPGYIRLACHRHPPLTGAYVTAFAEYRDSASGTSHGAYAAPGTHQAGDQIALFIALGSAAVVPLCLQGDGVAGVPFASQQNTTAGCLALFIRTATGSDDMTVTTTPSNGGAVQMRRIRRATGTPEATGTTGSGTAANAGTHTPTGGSQSRLVVTAATFCAGVGNQNSPSAFPTDYRTCYTPQRTSNTATAGIGCGVRTETASSYAPAWTGNIENWAAITATWE